MKKAIITCIIFVGVFTIFFCIVLFGCREDDETELARAAWRGDSEKVCQLIRDGADVNRLLGGSALMATVSGNREGIAGILLENGAKIDLQDYFGNSALSDAASICNCRMTKFLLDKGAQVNIQDRSGYTPLMICLDNKDRCGFSETRKANLINMTKLLISYGADVNARSLNGTTPLMLAVNWKGGVEIVRILIQKGADVNASKKNGDTALTIAIKTGDHDIINEIKKQSGVRPECR